MKFSLNHQEESPAKRGRFEPIFQDTTNENLARILRIKLNTQDFTKLILLDSSNIPANFDSLQICCSFITGSS